jgi:hypothetical protein
MRVDSLTRQDASLEAGALQDPSLALPLRSCLEVRSTETSNDSVSPQPDLQGCSNVGVGSELLARRSFVASYPRCMSGRVLPFVAYYPHVSYPLHA